MSPISPSKPRPDWWPEGIDTTSNNSRPKIFSPDDEIEVIFPTPIIYSDDPYFPLAHLPFETQYHNEYERGCLHFAGGVDPPITRWEHKMMEMAAALNGKLVDYHNWVLTCVEHLMESYPRRNPQADNAAEEREYWFQALFQPAFGCQMNSVLVSDDSSFGATPDFNLIPGIFTFTPERSDAALRGPYRTGFIGSEFVNLKFTHEELNVPEAYKGQVFKVLGSLYCSFRSGGYEGAPAAFAHILPLALSDRIHQLGYKGPLIGQSGGFAYPFPPDRMFDVYRKMPKPSSERFLRSEAGDNSSESCGSKVEVEAGNFKSTCEPAPFIFHKGKVYTVEVNPIAMMSECENIQADLDDMLKHQTPTSPHPEKEHRQTVNHKVPNGSFHDLGNANQSLMGGDVHQMQHHDLESADLFPQDVDGNLDQKSLGLDEIDKLFQKFTNHGLDVHAFQAAQESGIIEIASNILDEAQKLQEDGLPSTVLINLTEDDSNHHDEHQKNKIFDPPEESPNSMASPDSKEYVTTAIRGKIDELIWMRKEMPAHPMFFDPSLEIFRSWVGAAAGEEPMPVHEVMQQGVDGFSRRIERNTDDKIFDDKLRPDLLMTILGSLLGYGSESGDEHAPEINDAVDGREHVLEDGSPRNILQETAEDPNTSAGKAPVLITRPLVAAPFVNTRKSVGKEPELPITKSVTAASVGNSGSRYSHVDPNLLGGQRYLKNHNFENKCAIKRAFGAAKPTNLPFHGFTFSGVSSADGIVIEEGQENAVEATLNAPNMMNLSKDKHIKAATGPSRKPAIKQPIDIPGGEPAKRKKRGRPRKKTSTVAEGTVKKEPAVVSAPKRAKRVAPEKPKRSTAMISGISFGTIFENTCPPVAAGQSQELSQDQSLDVWEGLGDLSNMQSFGITFLPPDNPPENSVDEVGNNRSSVQEVHVQKRPRAKRTVVKKDKAATHVAVPKPNELHAKYYNDANSTKYIGQVGGPVYYNGPQHVDHAGPRFTNNSQYANQSADHRFSNGPQHHHQSGGPVYTSSPLHYDSAGSPVHHNGPQNIHQTGGLCSTNIHQTGGSSFTYSPQYINQPIYNTGPQYIHYGSSFFANGPYVGDEKMSVHIGQTFDQQTDHVPEDFTGAEEAQAKENAEYIGLHGDLIQLPFAISDLQAAFEQGYLPGEYADAANSTTASSGKSALDRDLNGWMDEVFLPGSSGKRKAGDDGLASPLPDKRQKAVLNGVPGRSLARLGQRGGRW